MVDEGYVNMCIYMHELKLLFVKCSPYLSQFLKQDHIIFSHPLFQHPLYESWSRSSRLLATTLAKLEVEAPLSLSKLKGLKFKTKSTGEHLDIVPTTTCNDQALKKRIESIFTEVCTEMTRTVKKSLDYSNSTPIDVCQFSQVIYDLVSLQIANESVTLVDNIPDHFIDEVNIPLFNLRSICLFKVCQKIRILQHAIRSFRAKKNCHRKFSPWS